MPDTSFSVDAASLLRVWEEQRGGHPLVRALHLLAEALPERGFASWLHAPIGERDAALLALHEHLFGSALHTTIEWPLWGERLESSFSAHDMRRRRCAGTAACRSAPSRSRLRHRLSPADERRPAEPRIDAWRTGSARAHAAAYGSVQRGVEAIDVAALPETMVAELGERMAQQDPDADVRIVLDCPACRTAWQARFDIVSYLWGRDRRLGQRSSPTCVHALARAYGWSERAILALSPLRRQAYLDMVAA